METKSSVVVPRQEGRRELRRRAVVAVAAVAAGRRCGVWRPVRRSAMRIALKDHERFRAWFAVVAPELFPLDPDSEAHPLAVLDRLHVERPARALEGLA